ncbi:MAG: N-acyl homoserine lactonase family protein [Acidobacteriia bacterium]|nr:N-acyl homoserine lactonase family protein [Terriglobia bacterium]
MWQTNIGQQIWLPTTAWLVLGAGKPILVDTSFRSVEDAKALQYLTCRRAPEQTLEHQLQKHRLQPSEIGHIIHTHVHMDHAGQDYLFPNAKIYVQRRELQNAAAPNMYPTPFYDRLNVARLVHDLWNRVEILDGNTELFPGVRCVMMPGHTPGHQAVYISTPSGQTIIAGDAAMNVRYNVRQLIPPGFLDDMADTMNGLRRLAREGKYILCTHDDEVFDLYPEGRELNRVIRLLH